MLLHADGSGEGSEDCLFLNIYAPHGASKLPPNQRLPVMMWIHGGNYVIGSGTGYIGAPLVTTGNVIIVTINYRLGIFGFLSDENGNIFLDGLSVFMMTVEI